MFWFRIPAAVSWLILVAQSYISSGAGFILLCQLRTEEIIYAVRTYCFLLVP